MKTIESLGCGLYAGAAYTRVNTVVSFFQLGYLDWNKKKNNLSFCCVFFTFFFFSPPLLILTPTPFPTYTAFPSPNYCTPTHINQPHFFSQRSFIHAHQDLNLYTLDFKSAITITRQHINANFLKLSILNTFSALSLYVNWY